MTNPLDITPSFLNAIHVGFDLETLGGPPDGRITNLAAIAVAPYRDFSTDTRARAAFSADLEWDPSLAQVAGRTDAQTIKFWMAQPGRSREALVREPRTPPLVALQAFFRWYGDLDEEALGNVYVWCFGGSFDFPVLRHACERFGIVVPWSHKRELCARSIVPLVGDLIPDLDPNDRHTAMGDTIYLMCLVEAYLGVVARAATAAEE